MPFSSYSSRFESRFSTDQVAPIQVCDSRPPRPLGIKWAIGRKGRKREREEAKREEENPLSFQRCPTRFIRYWLIHRSIQLHLLITQSYNMLREGRKVQTNFDLVGRVVLGLGNVLSSSSWSPLARVRVRLSFSQNIHMHSGEVMVIFRHFFSAP